MGLYLVAVCYNKRQENTIHYNTTQQYRSHKITYHTRGKPQKAKLQQQQQKLGYILCTIKTQKQVEHNIEESVLKTTRCINSE